MAKKLLKTGMVKMAYLSYSMPMVTIVHKYELVYIAFSFTFLMQSHQMNSKMSQGHSPGSAEY